MSGRLSTSVSFDMKDLLRARLVVARLGEWNLNRWWRTEDLLGEMGAWVSKRTLPITHAVGRARMAMTVARHACDEKFRDPDALNLFRLNPETEDRLDLYLSQHLDDTDLWENLLGPLVPLTKDSDVGDSLINAGVATRKNVESVASIDLGPAGRSLPLSKPSNASEALRFLAAGYARSKLGELAVPYLERSQLS